MTLDVSAFTCSVLACELADEWEEYVATSNLSRPMASDYRRAVVSFCEFIDQSEPRAVSASLAGDGPDLSRAAARWVQGLPGQFEAGSRHPARLAGGLRRLVIRRAEHPARPVSPGFDGWLAGHLGVRRGETKEVDEFTRTDKRALVKAAWADLRELEARMTRGRVLLAAGGDPAEHGWCDPANLLWAIAQGTPTVREIRSALPPLRQWPEPLRTWIPDGIAPNVAGEKLLRTLLALVHPHNLDLHGFRILLMAATGRSSEEVLALTEDDVEYQPGGVLLTFEKNRAHRVRRDVYRSGHDDELLAPSQPRLDAAEIVRRLQAVTAPLAVQAEMSPAPLFLRASLLGNEIRIQRFAPTLLHADLHCWIRRRAVTVDGPVDIRRLRKSGKVEKAIAYHGRVSDIADDHSAEVFRRHYAHGTTLHVIAGSVITAAQGHWLAKALEGPMALTEQAQAALEEPDGRATLGLSRQQVEDLRAGALDMGVSGCRDPKDSPYAKPGQICPVAPLRCLECRNAFILPSNLPQLLLFDDFLGQLRLRLSPRHFHELWGQSHVNLRSALADLTDGEIAVARQRIAEEGLCLQLPLASQVEFDG
ncbi:hypothetical protein [Streptomyces acidiscabies]|uniref:hypothetical protein n=1 Tax=Streptomyces acidiscabies TaxID=42234 RepID=UPI0009A16F98|nr:hypothetical protein [Streptomyces acidiscabies]